MWNVKSDACRDERTENYGLCVSPSTLRSFITATFSSSNRTLCFGLAALIVQLAAVFKQKKSKLWKPTVHSQQPAGEH